MPVLGVVENMAGITCPHCHGEFHLFPRDALAQRLEDVGVESLTCIPLDPALARGSDEGMPDVLARPDGAVAAAFEPVIEACVAHAKAQFAEAAVQSLSGAFDQNLASSLLSEALQGLPDGDNDPMRQQLEELLGLEQQRLAGAARGQP